MTPRSATSLPLDPHDLARTQASVERANMLPPAAFASPEVLDWELDNIFRGWVCVGHLSAVDEPGKYVMRELGPDSIVVIGAEDGRPRAFLNVCRHRGARIVEEAEGQVRKRLRCPYHSWSYGLDGSLKAAPHMDEVEDFEFSCWGLIPVRLAVVGGLVLIDLSGEAPEVDVHVGDLLDHLQRYRLAGLDRAGEASYEVAANWKGIAENYNECLHCPGVHPELNALSDYMSGDAVPGEGSWCGGSMTLREGTSTMALEQQPEMGKLEQQPDMGKPRSGSAERRGRPAIAGLSDTDVNSVYYFALFPNALVSLHPDYVMLHTLWPRAADRTDVICEWFFEPQTIVAEGFDPSDAIGFWDTVNRQDWYVCELAQKGVRTRGYTAGRYSAEEVDVHAFDLMVADRYMEALRSESRVPA
jgi:glycine betaine catabolism A